MAVTFIHSSDWHIGKVFRFVDDATMGLLQEARLDAIARLGALAKDHGASHVVVAGDVYDEPALLPRSLNQPLERMRQIPDIQWHLLPGNHDSHRPNGLWDQLLGRGLPGNVTVHVTPEPLLFQDEGFALLPAPLFHRGTLDDPTAWMDDAGLPEGLIRVGLAHGTVRGFGSDGTKVSNFITPDRPDRSGLSYLALGDWHGQKQIGDRCWYSGTPEVDAFGVANAGQALLVEIEAPDAPPSVTPIATGHFTWVQRTAQISNRADIDHLAEMLRNTFDEPERVLVDLMVEGAVSLEDSSYFRAQIVDGVSAALRHLRVDDRSLFPKPTDEDLDRIDHDGFVRQAAERLKQMAESGEGDRSIAASALERLYVEHMKIQAGER